MIIPTPDFDPLYADDGVPFRAKMIAYIQREFSDLLAGRNIRSELAERPQPPHSAEAIQVQDAGRRACA